MPEEHFFSPDYATARHRFCDAAAQGGWELTAHERSGGRPEELWTDVAYLGGASPRKLLVISSGLHGAEGFLGSAIQLQLLKQFDREVDSESDVAIVLVHALNPFGFSRIRRMDEKNIDTNRNFLLLDEKFEGAHPTYRKLNTFLNPQKWPRKEFPLAIQAVGKRLRYGSENLKAAFATGQYEFPLGLFYGGDAPCKTTEFAQLHLLPILSTAQHVLHLDIHTGLGKPGTAVWFRDHPITELEAQDLINVFYPPSTDVQTPYPAKGSISRWVRNYVPQAVSACWEFGTHSPVKVLSALRAENAATHWGEPGSRPYAQAKQQLLEAFCPASSRWRRHVLKSAAGDLVSVLDWLTDDE